MSWCMLSGMGRGDVGAVGDRVGLMGYEGVGGFV